MAQTKATKKFEKKHLKDVLERRKKFAKIKQKQQVREKKKARRAAERDDEDNGNNEKDKNLKQTHGNPFEHMSVDEFFQGGFEIPKELQSRAKKSKQKDATTKAGKRKRDEFDAGDEDMESDEDDFKQEQFGDAGSEPESEAGSEDMKAQLDALAENDPEFYKHLQEEDPELLEFDADAFAEIDALSEEEERSKERTKNEPEPDTDSNEITMAKLDKWEKGLTEHHSLRFMKEVVMAFRTAAYLNEDGKSFKYTVSNSDVYNRLLNVTLKHLPDVLQHHLPVKETKSGKVSVEAGSKKYRTITPLLKSHITSVQHLLSNLSDDSTQRLTLGAVLPMLPYILSFKKAVRDLAKVVVAIWSSTSTTEAARISAFLILRRLVAIGDPGIKESVLRSAYQGLLQGFRSTTIHTIAAINMMKNSAAELWGLDQAVGYTTGFTFIRQLAIHLRSSIANPGKESYKQVYNWQYIHSLDFWSRVLSLHCSTILAAETGKESSLKPLVYPVVQVTLGAMRLIPTPQYFPLRFLLVRSLLRVSRATGTYVPLAPALYEVLGSVEMKKAPRAATLKQLDFETSIRAPKAYLRTRVYQDGLGEQVAELLAEFFVLWCKNVAFPELALPVVVVVKRWLREVNDRQKGNRNGKVNAQVALVVQKMEANSRWIEEKRRKVDFAPNNRAGVEGFLKEEDWEKTPLGAFVVGQRKLREEKKKVLEEGRREEERKKTKDKEQEERVEGDSFDEMDAQDE